MSAKGDISGDSIYRNGVSPFSLEVPEAPGVPILIAAPHGGRSYSPGLLENMRQPEYSALRLEDRHVDQVAKAVAHATSASLLIAHTPRAMIDLNRSDQDVDWHMIIEGAPAKATPSAANRRSRSGLGLIPRRLPIVGEIWRARISQTELDERIETIHRPYHRALAQQLAHLRDRWGAALLLDIHSMPPLGNRRAGEAGAEFVVGDRFGASSDPMLSSRALSYFSTENRLVAHNRPYSGGYVLDRHGMPARGIHALQIEICRSLYLDRQLSEPTARMASIVKLLSGLVRTLAEEVTQMGGAQQIPMAAE
ncbi:N-formylglutamate amidohydrolase [Altererythrobacter sp. MF3-039]|uniref:N-formylglutamate amidohydrolase n=1 Tax=Altererythrobacter sp. MF3-039 TaxID=3252901 RepID=UPI00390C504A